MSLREEVEFWRRANVTARDWARVRGIALNLANMVYQTCKDQNVRAEIAELRRLLMDNNRGDHERIDL